MADEAIIEDVGISGEESQLVDLHEDGEAQEREESKDGYTIIVDDGISTPENPGMMISTRAGHLFLIDAEDWPSISGFRWWVSGDGKGSKYVHTEIGGKKRYLHRLILRAPNDHRVDHRNGDPLDNRKANLRLATHQQNMFNRRKARTYGRKPTASYYKGVTWDRSRGKHKAQITKSGVNHYLGRFLDERRAAEAYDHAAIEKFGEFAQTNFTYDACEEGTRPGMLGGHRPDLTYTLAS